MFSHAAAIDEHGNQRTVAFPQNLDDLLASVFALFLMFRFLGEMPSQIAADSADSKISGPTKSTETGNREWRFYRKND